MYFGGQKRGMSYRDCSEVFGLEDWMAFNREEGFKCVERVGGEMSSV